MGMRLHVHKKHVIEYADIERFNYKYNEFQELLETLGCETTPNASDCPDEFEVSKKEYERALNTLKTIQANPDIKEITIEPINEYEEEQLLDVQEDIMFDVERCYGTEKKGLDALNQIIEDMQSFYDAADKSDEMIYFSAF